jgi:hypothetical protein
MMSQLVFVLKFQERVVSFAVNQGQTSVEFGSWGDANEEIDRD